ncbi:MAG: Nif3-like dinuclear metal center hexameric protein [Eubacteriales bacterium]
MNALELYNHLETDFPVSVCDDNWSGIGNLEYITEQYKACYMGLVTNNSEQIDYVYTAVFPSREVIEKIISDNRKNALLFVHHPMDWNITKFPIFTDIPSETLKLFKERNVSIFNYHSPLDANGEYSTTVNFAKALGVEKIEEFCKYHGVLIGVIGKTDCKTVSELQSKFEIAVGHSVKLYQYGDSEIKDSKVALVAGGGNDLGIYPILKEKDINTYLTGITRMFESYPPSIEGHNFAKECGINILSGTHYSTEKFSCIKMVEYFSRLGINGEFISGMPCLDDM